MRNRWHHVCALSLGLAFALPVFAQNATGEAGEGPALPAGVSSDGASSSMLGIAPSEEEARNAFAAARETIMSVAEGEAPVPEKKDGDVDQVVASDTVSARPENAKKLEDIHLVMDVENVTLRDVMAKVVRQAAAYTGPWTVKWRLLPENSDLLDEKVNLTVESTFAEFCSLLSERVKNMTGTKLYVTVFNGARVILITDTYY